MPTKTVKVDFFFLNIVWKMLLGHIRQPGNIWQLYLQAAYGIISNVIYLVGF